MVARGPAFAVTAYQDSVPPGAIWVQTWVPRPHLGEQWFAQIHPTQDVARSRSLGTQVLPFGWNLGHRHRTGVGWVGGMVGASLCFSPSQGGHALGTPQKHVSPKSETSSFGCKPCKPERLEKPSVLGPQRYVQCHRAERPPHSPTLTSRWARPRPCGEPGGQAPTKSESGRWRCR